MNTVECPNQKNALKILIPFVIVWSATVIAEAGYHFGQWLHAALN